MLDQLVLVLVLVLDSDLVLGLVQVLVSDSDLASGLVLVLELVPPMASSWNQTSACLLSVLALALLICSLPSLACSAQRSLDQPTK
ncbi:Uncharacterised protein [Mycobacteroides abscessus subsp. abscessus]|nr:Uncharacterised protein [Mycobacteroides abscessus subsp. abscessus]